MQQVKREQFRMLQQGKVQVWSWNEIGPTAVEMELAARCGRSLVGVQFPTEPVTSEAHPYPHR
ncbi:hypothetical protein Taro_047326 [Colocasia esculenta]|uniref:Uncharacterized protein n=1 Tax=Colocasia esculenta TaxID=4460 RepID=A0A843X711_COLES|nr:hypothetical protein [Colocasia esculenta]